MDTIIKMTEINNDKLIGSARGITQMNINGKRLITIIGELHEKDFDCDNSITIYEYCKYRAKKNPKCVFLFEFEPTRTHGFEKIGSKIIRDVFTGEDNIVRRRSTGVDVRLDHITMRQQQHLYNG